MTKLRCWPGCLAEVVRPGMKNTGRLVQVIEPSPGNTLPVGSGYTTHGKTWERSSNNFYWLVKGIGGPLVCPRGSNDVRPLEDAALRPITPPAGSVTDSEVRELFAPKQTEEA